MKRYFSVLLVLMVLLLTSCGNTNVSSGVDDSKDTLPGEESPGMTAEPPSNVDEDETSTGKDENTTPTFEGINISSYDDIDSIYQFDLNGKHYSLPCLVSDFLSNGDTISESDLSYIVPANHVVGQIYVHPEGIADAKIELSVINDSDQDMSVLECNRVVAVTVREDSNVDFVIGPGINILDPNTSVTDLQKYYGTMKPIYSSSEGDDYTTYSWHFYKKINSEYDDIFFNWGYSPGMDEIRLSNTFEMRYIGRPD